MTNTYNAVLAQIGGRICRCREDRGLSGAELAIRANLPASTLSKIENGRRNIGVETFCSIARAMEVPLSEIQPKDLDVFAGSAYNLSVLAGKLKRLSTEQRAIMLAMFNAQIDVLLEPAREN